MHCDAIGKTAVVIGAGIGGLTAARAVADFFAQVIVLERDALPESPVPRAGTPQDRHAHGLLGGGLRALNELFPGFEQQLAAAGAIPYRFGLDVVMEFPDFESYPRYDLGLAGYYMSRPLLELEMRRCLMRLPNVTLRQHTRALALVGTGDGSAVAGVRCSTAREHDHMLPADLVIDASGRGALTLELLDQLGIPRPGEDSIGVDIGYASGIFSIPAGVAPDWLSVRTLPDPPRVPRGGQLMTIEHKRWLVTLGSRTDKLPAELPAFLAMAKQCNTPTIHEAIANAELEGDNIARFRFPASIRRHFDRLARFPERLIPIADALCCFNPIWGQGISAAVMEARLLMDLLRARVQEAGSIAALSQPFFAGAHALIETPWRMAAYPDLADPQIEGQRPADLLQELRFRAALRRLAAKDPAVGKLNAQVSHLLAPPSVLATPELLRRLELEVREQLPSVAIEYARACARPVDERVTQGKGGSNGQNG